MAKYPNGRIPKDTLVHLGGDHYLTQATALKWEALVNLVKRRHNVTLRITPGPNAYRDYAGQVEAKRKATEAGRPMDAATPGTSSHGGEYQGRDSMAIDVYNWGAIGRAAFYTAARESGFEPGYFSWEPWHIIDWEPYKVIPQPEPEPQPKQIEEDEMLFLNIDSKYLVSVGVGVLKHWGPSTSQATRERVKNISRADNAWQSVTFEQFTATLSAYGCDPNIWDVRTFGKVKDFCVLNPLDGSVKQGNTWTAVNAMRAEARVTQGK